MSTEVRFVYVGTTGPLRPLIIEVPAKDAGADLSTVTGAVIDVEKPDGTTAIWSATIAWNATKKLLTVSRVLVAGDVDQEGAYTAFAVLTLPAGTLETARRTFIGHHKYDLAR